MQRKTWFKISFLSLVAFVTLMSCSQPSPRLRGVSPDTRRRTVKPTLRPPTTSRTQAWHPLCFEKDLSRDKPIRVEFPDVPIAVWRKDSKTISTMVDVCPHKGARLSTGSVTTDGCVKCSYHALCWGEGISNSQGTFKNMGSTIVCNGIVWWHPSSKPKTGKDCSDLQDILDRNDITVVRTSRIMNATMHDSVENSMDVYHASHVHSSTFGNINFYPNMVKKEKVKDGVYKIEFNYQTNRKLKKVIGSLSENYHIFEEPCTTWNKVENSGSFVFIHVAFRSVSDTQTEWFVTSCSNYLSTLVPSPLREQFLLYITNRILDEDSEQLSWMAPVELKRKHSGSIYLPHDDFTA